MSAHELQLRIGGGHERSHKQSSKRTLPFFSLLMDENVL